MVIATPAIALSQQTREFLASLGIDPDSAQVKIAEADGEIHTTFRGDPEVFSLEKLAADKRANAVRQFIFTRSLIREIKAKGEDYHWPKDGNAYPDYDGRFLTTEERLVVVDKLTAR
jgi:hypothetical protein